MPSVWLRWANLISQLGNNLLGPFLSLSTEIMRIIKVSSSAGPLPDSQPGWRTSPARGVRQPQLRSALHDATRAHWGNRPPRAWAQAARRPTGPRLGPAAGYRQAPRAARRGALRAAARGLPRADRRDGLNALVVDLAILGRPRWNWLQRICRLGRTSGSWSAPAPSTVAERVRALRMGVDDWLTKPCHPEELIARVEVVVSPRELAEPRHRLQPVLAGELEIRRHEHQAFVRGQPSSSTAREFQLPRAAGLLRGLHSRA